jgi:hypothetical protein
MRTLESLFPDSVSAKCVWRLDLCGVPYPEVLQAIEVATAEAIAILGAELFRVEDSTLLFLTGSAYEFPYDGRWGEFVKANNAAARAFVMENLREQGSIYILTSTCREEYQQLTGGENA